MMIQKNYSLYYQNSILLLFCGLLSYLNYFFFDVYSVFLFVIAYLGTWLSVSLLRVVTGYKDRTIFELYDELNDTHYLTGVTPFVSESSFSRLYLWLAKIFVIYFSSSMLYLFFFGFHYSLFFGLTLLTCAFILYLFYFQFFIVKIWCVFSIIYLFLFLLQLFIVMNIEVLFVLDYHRLFCFILIVFIGFLLIQLFFRIVKQQALEATNCDFYKDFYKNKALFNLVLNTKKVFDVSDKKYPLAVISKGNPNGKTHLTLYLDLHDGASKILFQRVFELLVASPYQICLDIFFNVPNTIDRETDYLQVAYKIFETRSFDLLDDWYEDFDAARWLVNHGKPNFSEDFKKAFESNSVFVSLLDVPTTSTLFVNGAAYPAAYYGADFTILLAHLIRF
ncbi:hypothetical protein [Flavobacterium lacisediminis]|uniref:Uncharacterized protein n=1 Tax=Flavobacterium lacisediminis TaxID=2989705 RepID=A0ABT3EL50_9FLAO|nr:hypothetical protein [Flavobacterium lacisediminis]MCW1148835.1 hypothetical protein [Flavobacterium lacisediminis]